MDLDEVYNSNINLEGSTLSETFNKCSDGQLSQQFDYDHNFKSNPS